MKPLWTRQQVNPKNQSSINNSISLLIMVRLIMEMNGHEHEEKKKTSLVSDEKKMTSLPMCHYRL